MSRSPLTPVDEAIEYLLTQVSTTEQIETVPLSMAVGRVLAEDQISTIDVPPMANSAMDGYAVRFCDLNSNEPMVVSQRIPAGTVGSPHQPNTVARIFTGAPVPEGADTVIMQEQCTVEASVAGTGENNMVSLPDKTDVEQGQNVRAAGEDLRVGQQLLSAGTRLRPQELGLLASVGVSKIAVFKKLKIAVLSTGDELIEPGSATQPGQIYNSNRYTLEGLISGIDLECVSLGIVADSHAATEIALQQAASKADVIITSGGVSVGEEDHVKAVIEQSGFLHLWKLAIKPGKPFAYGEFDGTPVLALPGNPAAVLITFLIVAKPYLLKMQGQSAVQDMPMVVEADFELSKPSIRRRYLQGQLSQSAASNTAATAETSLTSLTAQIYPNQSSGILSGPSWASGVVVVDIGQTVHRGDPVQFYSYADLLA